MAAEVLYHRQGRRNCSGGEGAVQHAAGVNSSKVLAPITRVYGELDSRVVPASHHPMALHIRLEEWPP
jgi:hypothetical protein